MNKALLFAFAALVITSCGRRTITGRGASTTINRNISGSFQAIDISAPVTAHVHVQPGSAAAVHFSGYKNLIDALKTNVEGNVLHIESQHSINFDTDKDVVADITVGSLSELGIHGAADADVDGVISGGDFRLNISGAGDVSIEKVNVTSLEAKISGAGNVNINSGAVTNADYKVSGAGNISSFGVQAANVKAKVSGAGDIDVYASRTLEAKVSGAGTIQYKGAASVRSETSGIGSIVAAN